jgi:hypothetical protein
MFLLAHLLNYYNTLACMPRAHEISIREVKMKIPIFGVTLIASILAVTLFFIITQEGEARIPREDISAPYHRYKLQYSYNGKAWHDLITIENGELSKNFTYLRKGKKFPSLRYWYTYIDEEGFRRAVSIPLTVESPPEEKGRHA